MSSRALVGSRTSRSGGGRSSFAWTSTRGSSPSASRRGSDARLDRERVGDQRDLVWALDVVKVTLGRRDLGVAHPRLDLEDVGLGDHARAERVAQVVEAEWPERGSLE